MLGITWLEIYKEDWSYSGCRFHEILYMRDWLEISSLRRWRGNGTVTTLTSMVTSRMLQHIFWVGPSAVYCVNNARYFFVCSFDCIGALMLTWEPTPIWGAVLWSSGWSPVWNVTPTSILVWDPAACKGIRKWSPCLPSGPRRNSPSSALETSLLQTSDSGFSI